MKKLSERYLKKQNDLSHLDVRPPFPRIIKIDICNVCNEACLFCPQSKQEGKVGCIDDKLCRRLIGEAYSGGSREICLSSTGEPLLNRYLSEYIRIAKQLGYTYIFFNTNGILLTEKLSKDVISSGVDSVKISINASKRSYKLVHGIDGYDTVINNLQSFDTARKTLKSDCRLYVSFVSTPYTIQETEEVRRDTENFIDEFVVMNANNRAGAASEVDEDLYQEDDEYSYSYPCSQIFNNIYVTAEGFLTVCAQDFENKMVVADLNKASIIDAWNCDRFVSFRKDFLEGRITDYLCDNCLNHRHHTTVPLTGDHIMFGQSEKKKRNLMKRIKELKENSN